MFFSVRYLFFDISLDQDHREAYWHLFLVLPLIMPTIFLYHWISCYFITNQLVCVHLKKTIEGCTIFYELLGHFHRYSLISVMFLHISTYPVKILLIRAVSLLDAKQCRPRSDCSKGAVCSGSTMLASEFLP